MERSRHRVRKIAIQVGIFLALVALLEGSSRLLERINPRQEFKQHLGLQPYMMFAGGPRRGAIWEDILKNKKVPSTLEFNNYGFPELFDYKLIPDADYLHRNGKKPGERIVLITGGSVVYGTGATSNETTISARLMHHLNKKSNGTRYRVLNMAMGSWIAYQQFIALSLFGLPFDPDWIVVMDGHNDGAVPCIHGSGPGNPMFWPQVLSLTYGGSGQAEANSTIAKLARHSALVRLISGLRPDEKPKGPSGLVVDVTDPDGRFPVKMAGVTIADQDRQVAFYLQAQRNVLALFKQANVLLSTQPLYRDNVLVPSYRAAFAAGGTAFKSVEAELDHYMAEKGAISCERHANWADPLSHNPPLAYFMARSALRLIDFVDEAQKADSSRHIIYKNVEGALPYDTKLRERFFIDNAHLSDLGQDRVAEFFADIVLASERGTPFDFAAFAKRSAELAAANR